MTRRATPHNRTGIHTYSLAIPQEMWDALAQKAEEEHRDVLTVIRRYLALGLLVEKRGLQLIDPVHGNQVELVIL